MKSALSEETLDLAERGLERLREEVESLLQNIKVKCNVDFVKNNVQNVTNVCNDNFLKSHITMRSPCITKRGQQCDNKPGRKKGALKRRRKRKEIKNACNSIYDDIRNNDLVAPDPFILTQVCDE